MNVGTIVGARFGILAGIHLHTFRVRLLSVELCQNDVRGIIYDYHA